MPKWGQGAWGSVEQNGRIWESGFGSACPRFLPACAATNNPSHGAFMATSGPLALTGRPPIQQRIWAAASNETNLPTEWFLFLRHYKSVKSHDIAIFNFLVFVFMYFVFLSAKILCVSTCIHLLWAMLPISRAQHRRSCCTTNCSDCCDTASKSLTQRVEET